MYFYVVITTIYHVKIDSTYMNSHDPWHHKCTVATQQEIFGVLWIASVSKYRGKIFVEF